MFEIDFLLDNTDDALIGELRRVAALIPAGTSLSKATFAAHRPRVSHSTIQKRFGGWGQALQCAGLGHLYGGGVVSEKMRAQPAKALTDDDLLGELRRVHSLVQTPWLTTLDFDTTSITSSAAIRSRFGSFRNGLNAAGIASHPHAPEEISDVECFENTACVWIHHGRAPKYLEMFVEPSAIQGKTYVTRWGTWRKALIAFVDWANSEAKESPAPSESAPTGPRVSEPKSPRRSEADSREVRPGLRFKVLMRDGFRCLACGRSPATHLNVELHADHIIAVANGGKTTEANLQTLCRDCNLGKGKLRTQ